MKQLSAASAAETPDADRGCAYILERIGHRRAGQCGAPRQAGSSYCPHHHARCHLTRGSSSETARLQEIERLADSVGGRCAAKAAAPSPRFLDRLEALSRDFSRPLCS